MCFCLYSRTFIVSPAMRPPSRIPVRSTPMHIGLCRSLRLRNSHQFVGIDCYCEAVYMWLFNISTTLAVLACSVAVCHHRDDNSCSCSDCDGGVRVNASATSHSWLLTAVLHDVAATSQWFMHAWLGVYRDLLMFTPAAHQLSAYNSVHCTDCHSHRHQLLLSGLSWTHARGRLHITTDIISAVYRRTKRS